MLSGGLRRVLTVPVPVLRDPLPRSQRSGSTHGGLDRRPFWNQPHVTDTLHAAAKKDKLLRIAGIPRNNPAALHVTAEATAALAIAGPINHADGYYHFLCDIASAVHGCTRDRYNAAQVTSIVSRQEDPRTVCRISGCIVTGSAAPALPATAKALFTSPSWSWKRPPNACLCHTRSCSQYDK